MATTLVPSLHLIMEVRRNICQIARGELPSAIRGPRAEDWDVYRMEVIRGGTKADYLAFVTAAHLMTRAVESAAAVATSRAIAHGASYAELAAIEGVSRQAVRLRHERARAVRRVRLHGGPRDGETAVVRGKEREVRRPERKGPWEQSVTRYDEWDDGDDRYDDGPGVTGVYRAQHGSPDVFEFQHLEDHRGKIVTYWDRRPKVEELAAYWGLSRDIVRDELKKLQRVVTPYSRVALDLLEPLRQQLEGTTGYGDLPSASPEPFDMPSRAIDR